MHIEHNMDNVVDLRVHIAPVGYEEDRIVIPAVQKKADRVWLLVHSNPSEDRALQFTERITKKFVRNGSLKLGFLHSLIFL